MKAVILAPGPSLANYQTQPADLTIAINRAALKFSCDAWACCDLPAIEAWHEKVIGSPILIASIEQLDNLRDRKIFWRGEEFNRRRLLNYCPHGMDWVLFSSTTAIVYAAWRGAKEIKVFGMDLEGALDWDGEAAGKNRSVDRWDLEKGIVLKRLKPWLAERNIALDC